MARSAWTPWNEIRYLEHEMEQLLAGAVAQPGSSSAYPYPPVNLTREEDGVTIDALCPGCNRETLDVSVVGEVVTIRCECTPPADVPPEAYHRRERPVGAFTRAIATGERFDPERTEATYAHGVLRVRLARAADRTPKKIEIRA